MYIDQVPEGGEEGPGWGLYGEEGGAEGRGGGRGRGEEGGAEGSR